MPSRVLIAVVSVALLITVSGCTVSIPKPAFHQVDQEAPAFKEAVALEKKRQQDKGKSSVKAEATAVRKVTRDVIRTESERRAEKIVPLSQALDAFERARGCWAYTFTTTTRRAGKTTVEVARFDAFQPEERLWTLISRDGEVPDDETQANYRRANLKAWKKSQDGTASRSKRRDTLSKQMWNRSSFSDLTIAEPDTAGETTYTFVNKHGHFPMVGDIPAVRTTYTTDSVGTLVRQTETFLERWSVMAGAVKFQIWDTSSEYVLIEPGIPPFPSKTKIHQHVHVFGKDYGEIEIETVYTDYRRVKCYDERFEVKIGAPSAMDIVPAQP